MARTQAVTDAELVAFIERADEFALEAHGIAKRLEATWFGNDYTGLPSHAQTLNRTIRNVADVQAILVGKIAMDDDANRLKARLTAEAQLQS